MPALKRFQGTRIASTPAALDAVKWPKKSIVMRLAPDEAYVTPPLADESIVKTHDKYAIVLSEGAFSGVWLEQTVALEMLQRLCRWELPQQEPAFAQGAVAGIPTKLWFTGDRVLLLVPAPYAAEMEERLQ